MEGDFKMKKISILFFVLAIVLCISGCKSDLKNQIESSDGANDIVVADENKTESKKSAEEIKSDKTEYKSELGFKVEYDEEAFLHSFENGIEKFDCIINEEQKLPIYIAIQLLENTDAQSVADGLALQSGRDDVTVTDTIFGGGGMLAKGVNYTEKVNGVEQIFSFHAIDTEKGVVLIEAVGYVDQPKKADSNMEEFFARFFVE